MKIYPIESGNFKLDGGAMFGVVPKTIWNKTNPADSNNLIELAARCMLIEDGNKLILIDTGMGNKQSDKFFGYYSPKLMVNWLFSLPNLLLKDIRIKSATRSATPCSTRSSLRIRMPAWPARPAPPPAW